MRTYSDIRPLIETGDAILFMQLTLPQAWSLGWRGLVTWVGNWVIALAQWVAGESFDGAWKLVHVGVAVRDNDRDRVSLLEFTAGQKGPGMGRLSTRINNYPGAVLWLPLKSKYRARMNWEAIQRWIRIHSHDDYRWTGLHWSVLKHWPGWGWPGALFCSEGAVSFLQSLSAVACDRPIIRGPRIIAGRVEPQTYNPAEVARLPQYDWSEGAFIWRQ